MAGPHIVLTHVEPGLIYVVLQSKAHQTNEMFQIQTPLLPDGSWVHFDIDVNPLTDHGEEHVYLWGFLKPPYDSNAFEYVWTDH